MLLKRITLLMLWVILSFFVSASAGDSAIYGHLTPIGPSFMAGEYTQYGFNSNDLELYVAAFWLIGLSLFFLKKLALLAYIIPLISFQIYFIEKVDDPMLSETGYLILIPLEAAFLFLFLFLVRDKEKE